MPADRESRKEMSHSHRRRRRSESSSDSGYERKRQNRPRDEDRSEGIGRQSRHDNRRRTHRGAREEGDYLRKRSESPREKRWERGYVDPHHRRDHEYRKDRSSRSPRPNGKKQKLIGDRPEAPTSRKKAGPLPSQADSFSQTKDPSTPAPAKDADTAAVKQKANMAPTGFLAAESNKVATGHGTEIVLKYHEPAEARKAPAHERWKLFVFKGADLVESIELGARSCWLVGRERAVADLAAEHPSISKQHAVLQFRYLEARDAYGERVGRVRPYLLDLESANGTRVNAARLPPRRYVELRDKDLIQFADSTREYVLMLPPRD